MKRKKEDNYSKIVSSKENLAEFLDRFAQDDYKYGCLQFTIYDYEIFENCREMGNPAPELTGVYRGLVGDFLNGVKSEEIIPVWKKLREDIIAQMEAITAFTDSFTIYEYLLNRAELKFTNEEEKAIDADDTANGLLQRIFSEKDNNTINLKLQTILSQLPVRITSDKFYNIIEDSLKLYINSEKSSAEKLKYMVRSAAGLYKPAARADFEELLEVEEKLANLNYKDITEAEYNEATEALQSVTTTLTELSEHYNQLQNAVNQLGIMVYTRPYVSEKTLEEAGATEALTRWIAENPHSMEPVPEELVDLFKTGEGKLEELSDALQQLAGMMEYLMDSNMATIKDMGLYEMALALETCGILASDSIYAPLEDTEDGAVADEAYIAALTKEIQDEFKAYFEGKEPKKRRAIMAAVLGELPVFFPTKNAVLDYIANSLKNCKDYAEKATSIALVNTAFDELEGM